MSQYPHSQKNRIGDANPASQDGPGPDRRFLSAVLLYGLRLHKSLDPRDVACDAVNDGLQLVGCERLSVATKQGRRFRVIAVSGQEKVVQRSESVRRLEELVARAGVLGRPIVYSGDLDKVETPLAGAMAHYLEESRARMVAIVPLFDVPRKIPPVGDREEPAAETPAPFGVMVAEMFAASLPPQGMPRRCRLVADQVESAIAAARHYDRIPMRRSLSLLGTFAEYLRGRRLLLTFAVLAVIAILATGLALIPGTYRVACNGTLMPAERSYIFAPLDAKVVEILVEDGAQVAAGDLLVRLESESLSAELVSAEVAVDEQQKLVEALDNELRRSGLGQSDEESIQLQGELTRAEISLAGAIATRDVTRRRFALLKVKSPVDGVVNGFRLYDELINRPVSRGQQLFAVVQPDSPWQLELDIEEYRAGPVSEALATSSGSIEVEYLLATDVSTKRWANLTRFASRVDQSAIGEDFVIQAIAPIPGDGRHEANYVGAEVFAKVHCGRKPLGYVLFGDLIDFLRRKLWW